MAKTIVSVGDLASSAKKYRKELLIMPVTTAMSERGSLVHMTPRPDVCGEEVVGELTGDIEMVPYHSSNAQDGEGGFTITPRTLKTNLGKVVHKFDPNDAWGTIYGSLVLQGENLKNVDIAKEILFYVMGVLGKKLNKAVWNGQYNANGTTTAELFDGFDTITQKEITATKISAALGNYKAVPAIGKTNAVDVMKDIYQSADEELQDVPTKMFISREIYNAYCEDYKASTGAVPYNTEFKKTFLEGSNDLCELVPLSAKKGSKFIHLTTKGNMLYGFGNLPENSVEVAKYEPFKLTLEAASWFGVEFESINKERLMVAEIGAAQ